MAAKAPAIISLEEFNDSINMLIYGNSGVGKTALGGTCPNSLFLAIESGTISAKRLGSTSDLWPIKTWNDLQEAADWLEANPEAYQWLIIDTVTQMQRLCMRGILDYQVAENSARDLDIPARQDWQKYYNMFQRFILTFNSMPINVLYLAQPMTKDNDDGDSIIVPEIAGPSHSPLRESLAVCASVDIVGYMQKSSEGKADDAPTKRSLLFEGMEPYIVCKDRYDTLPRWVTVTKSDDGGKSTQQLTTMADIAKRIEESGSKPVAKVPKKAVKAAPAKAGAVRRRPTR